MIEKRKSWMSLLATSNQSDLLNLWEQKKIKVNYVWLRTPEIGSIMAQGRMGVTGDKFNIGEVTITRCSLKLNCGTIGHSYVQGRSKKKAEISALCDALMQTKMSKEINKNIIIPLGKIKKDNKDKILSKAEATKVDFFTLVRGESD
ncbi:MAG: phosphonate C-P lyase system protein PhnG [Candidatus Puniceispirillales bacterium]|jgi:alpha-D-ribose 1-methylphosphonate 5-triphosphate synthase subunit PhnG|tara:strand:- start:1720 stop:2160 length:441 start_codon:yes stop_codon:yes gene_type:complete